MLESSAVYYIVIQMLKFKGIYRLSSGLCTYQIHVLNESCLALGLCYGLVITYGYVQ